jgi:putative membrane protein
VGSVPYLRHDWTRPLYFAILIPHVVLAGLVVPFILVALWFALNKKFDRHKKLVRFVWPVWLFVCVSGIAVYLMLYQL